MASMRPYRGQRNDGERQVGEAVVQALLAAQAKPVVRAVDPARLKGWPKRLKASRAL